MRKIIQDLSITLVKFEAKAPSLDISTILGLRLYTVRRESFSIIILLERGPVAYPSIISRSSQ